MPVRASSAESPGSAAEFRPVLATVVGAAGLLALVHAPAVDGYFVGDDFIHLGQVRARTWNLLADDDPDRWFRPVTKLTFGLDHVGWRLDARGYHVTNILIHGANAGLVAAVAHRLAGLGWASALAGILFAVHPAHATTVSWISARADLLVTMFALVAALAQARLRRGGGIGARLALGAAVLLACGAKETGVAVPALLLALDRIGAFDPRGRAPAWRASLAVSAGLVAVVVGYLALRAWVLGEPVGGVRPDRLLAVAWVPYELALAAVRLLAPVHVSGVDAGWRLGLGALALALEAVAIAAVVREGGARVRALRVGATWLLVALLPVAPLFRFRDAWGGERYLYLAGVGGTIVLAVVADRLARRLPLSAHLRALPAATVLAATVGLLSAGARREVVAWAAVTGAVPAIQRHLGGDPEIRAGDVVLVLAAPGNPHGGPGPDVTLSTQLSLALVPPYFPLTITANPYRVPVRSSPMHVFVWREAEGRLERLGRSAAPGPRELPVWSGARDWTARDLDRVGDWWVVAGSRPALVSPPVMVHPLGVAGLELAMRRRLCARRSPCGAWRALVESWHPATWRLQWAVGDGDWETGPARPFRVAPQPGLQRIPVHLLYDARWVTAGRVGRLALLPPPEADAFEVEDAWLVSRYESPQDPHDGRPPGPARPERGEGRLGR